MLLYRLKGLLDDEIGAAIDALPNRVNEHGYDQWGFSPEKAKIIYSLAKRVVFPYFRPEIHGIENLPKGRMLVVPNHSGQLPVDGLVIALACLLDANPPRLLRPMAERWFPKIPYVNELFWRGGVALGDPINCRNLLEDDQAILVFPEGAKGIGKPWKERYRLRPFGRGFMRLALETKSPVVPVSVVGGEESIISVYNWQKFADLTGLPYFPVSPFLPILGAASYLPLPVKFHVYFGKPMYFEGPHDDEDSIIDQKAETVRAEVQQMLDEGLAKRSTIF